MITDGKTENMKGNISHLNRIECDKAKVTD